MSNNISNTWTVSVDFFCFVDAFPMVCVPENVSEDGKFRAVIN